MKKITATLILIATVANAQWLINDNTGNRRNGWNLRRVELPTKVVFNPDVATCRSAGWREMTAGEIADMEAANAAAASNATAQASLPATFDTGVAVMNEAGHWVEFVPDGTNVVAETLAIQISNSPLDPETRKQLKADAIAARETKRNAAKDAKKNGNLQRRLAALEALLGVE